MITYTTSLDKIYNLNLENFFVGWPNPPSNESFVNLLKGSYRVVLAIEDAKLVGFISSISDGVISAYIPLLEVLPNYQGCGIGKELVSKMKNELGHLYMIDLLCDEDLIPFYEKLGMKKSTGALIRNYENQNGYENEIQ